MPSLNFFKPITLKDGSRISGKVEGSNNFYGYDKNGEQFVVKPEWKGLDDSNIVSSKTGTDLDVDKFKRQRDVGRKDVPMGDLLGPNAKALAPVTAGSIFALGSIPEQAEASTTPQPLQDLGQAISSVEVPLLGNIFEGTGNFVANMGREEDRMKRVLGAAGDFNIPAALLNIFNQ